jgi:hypothetical protein
MTARFAIAWIDSDGIADIVFMPKYVPSGYPLDVLLLRQSFYAKTAEQFGALMVWRSHLKHGSQVLGERLWKSGNLSVRH